MLTVRDYQSAESFGHFNDLSENEEMQEFKIGNSDSEQMNEQRQIPPPVSPSSSLIHREGLTEEFVKCN